MKKSTIFIIFVVYVASIIMVGFFGMSIKSFDQIQYVKSIGISIEAESHEMYDFNPTPTGIDQTTKNPKYSLKIYFTEKALFDQNNEKYLPLNIIPKVTYDSGDVAGANEEGIAFSISNQKYVEEGYVSLSDNGTLILRKSKIAFMVYVNPVSKAGNGTGAVIQVVVY